MTKLNWNRPNGGYTLEPWQKTYPPAKKRKTKPECYRLSFGLYKGKDIQEVPTDYLEWIVKTIDYTNVVNAANRELLKRGK